MDTPPNAPLSLAGLKELLPVILVGMLGGVVSFARKVKSGAARWLNVSELIGELVSAGFTGVVAYWLCLYGGLNPWLTAALVGISGHAGSRALFTFERWAQRRIDGAVGIAKPDK